MDYVHCRYFNKHGWPTSTILPNAPTNEEEQATLIDTIQVHCHRVELCLKFILRWIITVAIGGALVLRI
jgi:hypothetical protein